VWAAHWRFCNDVCSPKRKGVEMAIGWFVLADQVIETSIAEWPLMTQSGHWPL